MPLPPLLVPPFDSPREYVSPQPHTLGDVNLVVLAIAGILLWYLFQIGSRRQEWLRFKIKRAVVGMVAYLIAAVILAQQKLPPIETLSFAVLTGLGCAFLLVAPPSNERRIPKSVRQAVIARDLTSKGLKWDPAKYHIDHVVPFSRGGDHSIRNLRVIEKQRNLGKGDKMPRLWDFLKR
jgi:hypothetical protein